MGEKMLLQNHQKIHSINNIIFTQREVDIASCILHHRGSKKIAEFLSISPKTAEAHTRNIMLKLGCHGRETIIDFLEKSEEFLLVKKHYASLRFNTFFEKQLKEVCGKISDLSPVCKIVCSTENKDEVTFFSHLSKHLKLAGIHIKKPLEEETPHSETYFQITSFKENPVQNSSTAKQKNEQILDNHTKTLYIILPSQSHLSSLQDDTISFATPEKYHEDFYSLLSHLVPEIDFNENLSLLKKFQQQEGSFQKNKPQQNKSSASSPQDKEKSFFQKYLTPWPFLKAFSFFAALLFLVLFFTPKLITHFSPEKSVHDLPGTALLRSDLPVPDTSRFLERPLIFRKIDSFLGAPKKKIETILLIGIGGSGKTTLARYYARKKKERLVWEINAQTRKSLRNSFESLAYALSSTPKDKSELQIIKNLEKFEEREKQILYFVQKKLREHKKWFLIYDNVDSFSVIKGYFPHDPKVWGEGKIILTTQNNNMKNSHFIAAKKTIDVPPLNNEEKINLYNKILSVHPGSKGVEKESVKRFVEKLPPFPLDLSVAAYYLRSSGISPEKYLKHLHDEQESLSRAQERLLADVSDYTKTRHRIVTLSLEKLLQEHSEFKELLLLISLIGANRIPVDLLKINRDEIVFERFLYHLQKYSLISFDNPKKNTFSMHLSTQDISLKFLQKKLDLNKNSHFVNTLAETLKKYVTGIADEFDEVKMRNILPHVISFKKNETLFSDESRGRILTQFARVYYYLGDYDRAVQLLERSQQIYEKYHNDDYHRLACVLTYIGKVYRNFGDYVKAKNLLEKSLEILNKYESKDRLKYAWIAAHLGNVYRSLGLYDKSTQLLKKSLNIYKNYYGENNIKVAWISVHLGRVYMYLGRYQEAYDLTVKSYPIYVNRYGETHALTNWVQSCLGKLHTRRGNLNEAKDLLKKSLAFYKKYYGPDHIQTAWAQRNLGRLFLKLKNYKNAEEAFQKSYDILLQKKNSDQYRSLELLSDTYFKKAQREYVANHYDIARKYEKKAKDLFTGTLKIVKKYFPPESPHLARLKTKEKTLNIN